MRNIWEYKYWIEKGQNLLLSLKMGEWPDWPTLLLQVLPAGFATASRANQTWLARKSPFSSMIFVDAHLVWGFPSHVWLQELRPLINEVFVIFSVPAFIFWGLLRPYFRMPAPSLNVTGSKNTNNWAYLVRNAKALPARMTSGIYIQ